MDTQAKDAIHRCAFGADENVGRLAIGGDFDSFRLDALIVGTLFRIVADAHDFMLERDAGLKGDRAILVENRKAA